jgi:hypothetical protein
VRRPREKTPPIAPAVGGVRLNGPTSLIVEKAKERPPDPGAPLARYLAGLFRWPTGAADTLRTPDLAGAIDFPSRADYARGREARDRAWNAAPLGTEGLIVKRLPWVILVLGFCRVCEGGVTVTSTSDTFFDRFTNISPFRFVESRVSPSYPLSLWNSATDGPIGSATAIDWGRVSPTRDVFGFGFTQVGDPTYWGSTFRSGGYLDFLVDTDASYDLAGTFVASESSPAGFFRMQQDVQLNDLTADHVLATSFLQTGSLNQQTTFTVGVPNAPGGRTANVSGDFSGILIAGHTYMLAWNYATSSSIEHLATYGTGTLNLTVDAIANTQPVPEPCTLVVWSLLGASGIGVRWVRRKRAA